MQIKLPFLGEINVERRKNATADEGIDERFKALIYGAVGRNIPITAETALQVSTVVRCVDVVAKNMASLPLHLYQRTTAGAVKAKDMPLYGMLHDLPNPETTAYDFWLMYVYNLMLTPAAFAAVKRSPSGFITGLYNLTSKYCKLRRNSQTGERYVEYDNGKDPKTTIYPENLMYTMGARLNDADNPLDPIQLAGKVLGLTASLQEHANGFFANGAQPGGIVSLQTALGETTFKQFIKDFNETYAGLKNTGKVMFLNGNAKFDRAAVNPNESQALESRQQQVYEICRMMGVSPFKVFEYGRATYGNMEQVNIEFVQETIDPMATRLQQSIYRDLLTPSQRPSYYAKWNLYGLLRGDTTAQTAFFNMLRQNGIKNANEIRELMDENRIPTEDGGDAYLVNGNMISLKTAMNAAPKPSGGQPVI